MHVTFARFDVDLDLERKPLTLIAYTLALGGGLPRTAYLTRADRFFVACAFLF